MLRPYTQIIELVTDHRYIAPEALVTRSHRARIRLSHSITVGTVGAQLHALPKAASTRAMSEL
jgi:hypothetical protein